MPELRAQRAAGWGPFPPKPGGAALHHPGWRQTALPRPIRGHLNPIAIIPALLLPLPCGLGGWGELWGEGKDAGDGEGERRGRGVCLGEGGGGRKQRVARAQ